MTSLFLPATRHILCMLCFTCITDVSIWWRCSSSDCVVHQKYPFFLRCTAATEQHLQSEQHAANVDLTYLADLLPPLCVLTPWTLETSFPRLHSCIFHILEDHDCVFERYIPLEVKMSTTGCSVLFCVQPMLSADSWCIHVLRESPLSNSPQQPFFNGKNTRIRFCF